LVSVTSKNWGTIKHVVSYAYDALGNLIGRTIMPYTSGSPGTPMTTRFVYDGSDAELLAYLRREEEPICNLCPANPEPFQERSPLVNVKELLRGPRRVKAVATG
jgi:hypothetical protein